MCTNLWPLELEVSSWLLSLIRLQKWVCSLSPLSPACLPLPRPLSNSFCLPQFLLPLRLSLSGYRSLKVCVIQASPSGNATDHLSPALLFSHLSMFLPLPCFLSFFVPSPDSTWQATAPQLVHSPCRRLDAMWLPLNFSSCVASPPATHLASLWQTSWLAPAF